MADRRYDPPVRAALSLDAGGQIARPWIDHLQAVAEGLAALEDLVDPVALAALEADVAALGVSVAALEATVAAIGVGVTDGSDAAAGRVGEFLRVVTGSPGPLMVHNVVADILSLPIGAGDWEFWGEAWFDLTGTAAGLEAAISTVSATLPVPPAYASRCIQAFDHTAGFHNLPLAAARISLAAPATLYLIGHPYYTTGVGTAYGRLEARRAR